MFSSSSLEEQTHHYVSVVCSSSPSYLKTSSRNERGRENLYNRKVRVRFVKKAPFYLNRFCKIFRPILVLYTLTLIASNTLACFEITKHQVYRQMTLFYSLFPKTTLYSKHETSWSVNYFFVKLSFKWPVTLR